MGHNAMVGLVIVSHSAQLAAGAAELARSVGGPESIVAATGGLDLPGRPLGTDALLVLRAIEEAYSDDGVVVLMDLGSAVLSAELALDLLPPERQAHVVLCDAPLVEGAVAAAVQARLGSPLAQVIAEARGALTAKAAHLAAADLAPDEAVPPAEPATNAGVLCQVRLTVRNRTGLHARPAARFVQAASRFPRADISVRNLSTGRGPANAKRLTSVLTLGVQQGHEIHLTATGADAQMALEALAALAAADFGEEAER